MQDPNFVSDAYAECYPSYHVMGTEIVESDDEDLGHMDAKVPAAHRPPLLHCHSVFHAIHLTNCCTCRASPTDSCSVIYAVHAAYLTKCPSLTICESLHVTTSFDRRECRPSLRLSRRR